ncbi:hypothetical protein MASR1M31_06330 [Porphyromonadaceae bacterium]
MTLMLFTISIVIVFVLFLITKNNSKTTLITGNRPKIDSAATKNSEEKHKNENKSVNEYFPRRNIYSDDLYSSKEWKDKSNDILKRDNYTCQCCSDFNPSKDFVWISNEDDIEIHRYDKYSGIYSIDSKNLDLVVYISFYDNKRIVMPILNVHHKRYIIGREIWDYNDNELITLCERCHRILHSTDEIRVPVMEENKNNGEIIHRYNYPVIPYEDKPLNPKKISTFPPWRIVKKIQNNEWEIADIIDPTIKLFMIHGESELSTDERIQISSKIALDFIKKRLNLYPVDI